MVFLENVRKEVTVTEGDTERYLTFDLHAQIGEHITGNALLGIDSKWPYSLTIHENNKIPPDQESTINAILNIVGNKIIVSGLLYISTNDVKEFKKDPYKFCVKNDILEGEKEDSNESDMAGSDISEGES